jgi:hypothetical protein
MISILGDYASAVESQSGWRVGMSSSLYAEHEDEVTSGKV